MRGPTAAILLTLLTSCAAETDGARVAINDPLALIDEITPGTLRLLVLPASYTCDPTTGLLTPDPPDVPEGMIPEAVADVTLEIAGGRAQREVSIPAGDHVVLVRGKGTDPVTMRPNVFIATACRAISIGAGETQEARLTLLRISGMGSCGDTILSPDEQCEDGNTTPGDGCSATCRTETISVNTTTAGTQDRPQLAWARGQRMLFTYDDLTSREILMRLLSPESQPIMTPSVLLNDATLDTALAGMGPLSGQQQLPGAAVAPSGRLAVAFRDFGGGMSRVRAAFFTADRAVEMVTPSLDDAPTSVTSAPSIAFASDGSAILVYQSPASATGARGVVFAAGSSTPSAPFEVGTGASGLTEARAIGAGAGFVVAIAGGGDVHVQRFGTDGAPRDASAVAVLTDAAGTQDQPAIGAQSDGRFLVAWRDGMGDGAGTSIRARVFGTDGAPAGEAFVVNSTTAGDQAAPSVAAAEDRYAVVFTSDASVRARVLAASGDPVPNREQPPTTADFVLGTGSAPSAAAGGSASQARWAAAWNEGGDIRARWLPLP